MNDNRNFQQFLIDKKYTIFELFVDLFIDFISIFCFSKCSYNPRRIQNNTKNAFSLESSINLSNDYYILDCNYKFLRIYRDVSLLKLKRDLKYSIYSNHVPFMRKYQ